MSMIHNERRFISGAMNADRLGEGAAEAAPPSIEELVAALDSETAREELRRRYQVELPGRPFADSEVLGTGAERRRMAIFNSW